MRAVKRWRYYCDHCKKVSGLRSAMEKHEKGCTVNPARECGICTILHGGMNASTQDLMALLPDPNQFVIHHPAESFGAWDLGENPPYDTTDDVALSDAVHAVLPKLREITGNCPACILAALRQKGIPVPIVTEFNFTKELDAARAAMNDAREEQEAHYH